MSPYDLIRAGTDFYEVQGVFLGAVDQESVIELISLTRRPPCVYKPILVPERLLLQGFAAGAFVLYGRKGNVDDSATEEGASRKACCF